MPAAAPVTRAVQINRVELASCKGDDVVLHPDWCASTGITLPTPATLTAFDVTETGTNLTAGRIVAPVGARRLHTLALVLAHADTPESKTCEIVCIGRKALVGKSHNAGDLRTPPEWRRAYLWKATYTIGTNAPAAASRLLAAPDGKPSLGCAESIVVDADHTLNDSCREDLYDGVNHAAALAFDGGGFPELEFYVKPASGCAVKLILGDA